MTVPDKAVEAVLVDAYGVDYDAADWENEREGLEVALASGHVQAFKWQYLSYIESAMKERVAVFELPEDSTAAQIAREARAALDAMGEGDGC